MSEHDQLRHLCRWNQHLSGENRCLRLRLRQQDKRIRELEQTAAELGVQQEAADIFLGSAMDGLVGTSGR